MAIRSGSLTGLKDREEDDDEREMVRRKRSERASGVLWCGGRWDGLMMARWLHLAPPSCLAFSHPRLGKVGGAPGAKQKHRPAR